ncbi:MAG: S-ribosylhomocysteine lyase [Bacteroidaceae bacterium]|nr:S-ribosylhomocysteine lyase [Bacteroidaceae bacterium]
MEVIPSFQVDHTGLRPGIYISRQDSFGDTAFTTYDIRMTAPNQEPAIAPAALHTIEHIVATYLRNRPDWKEYVIYWGPMGCLTGNYLILRGHYDCEVIRQLMVEAMTFVVEYEGTVPGAAPDSCGNYLLHDLPMAKWEAERYIQRLNDEFCSEYTLLERPDVDGLQFHDA